VVTPQTYVYRTLFCIAVFVLLIVCGMCATPSPGSNYPF
jgi:hypothetical protein